VQFAHYTIKPDEVAKEVERIQSAIGSATDVESFVTSSVKAFRGVIGGRDGHFEFDLTESPRAVRESIRDNLKFSCRFVLPVSDAEQEPQPATDLSEISPLEYNEPMLHETNPSTLFIEIAEFFSSCPGGQQILDFQPSSVAVERASELLVLYRSGKLSEEHRQELDQVEQCELLLRLVKLKVRAP